MVMGAARLLSLSVDLASPSWLPWIVGYVSLLLYLCVSLVVLAITASRSNDKSQPK